MHTQAAALPAASFPTGGDAIDLFAGAGGASLGISRAGYTVRAAVEFDPAAARTHAANHPKAKLFKEDIRKVDPQALMQTLAIERGELAVLNTCPPCQGFSSLHRGAILEERNDLVLQTIRWVRALRPAVLLMENVRGLASDPRFAALKSDLAELGYGVRHWLIDAADFGVPQHRVRLVMVAVRDFETRWLPETIRPAKRGWRRRVGAASMLRRVRLAASDPVHRFRRSAPIVAERIAAIPPDGSRFDLPDSLALDCHRKLKARNATGPYGRVPLRGPCRTLTTRCTTPSCGPYVHPTENRGLSLREAAILQTFPKRYIFCGNYGEVERQVGNAIPPRLTERVLRTLQMKGQVDEFGI